MPHSLAAAGFAYHSGIDEMFMAGAGSSARFLYELFTGGSDDGAAIACHFQTPPLELAAGKLARAQRLNVRGRGDFTVKLLADREDPSGVSGAATGFSASAVATKELWPRKLGREFAVRVEESSSGTGTEPKPLDAGGTVTLGAVALHALDFPQVDVLEP